MNRNFGFGGLFNNFSNNVRNSVDSFVHDLLETAPNFQPPSDATQFHRNASAPPAQSQRAPPASARAIRQLPTITVASEDLVDPSNRECCICLEE